jgi:hypothetical protein
MPVAYCNNRSGLKARDDDEDHQDDANDARLDELGAAVSIH